MLTLFWLSVFLLGYTFVGYPVILKMVTKFTPSEPPKFDDSYVPNVDVILVVRNAEHLVKDKIDSLQSMIYPKEKMNIVIISDYSTDSTVETIKGLGYDNITVVDNRHKSSKSACVNQAIALSKAEVLFLTDVRQPIDSLALQKLVRHFSDPKVSAVSGELVFKNTTSGGFAEGMDAYWRYEKSIRKSESQIGSVCGVTGAIYALRRADFKPIPDDTLLDDVLIPMNLVLNGKEVRFESEAIAYDTPSSDPSKEKSRKTRTLAGNWQLLGFEPKLLNPAKNPMWWQFISHKVLRLFAPLFLILIFIASFSLAEFNKFFRSVFLLQVFGYSSVMVASYLPNLMRIKPVRIAHSFVMLMVFTFSGFWLFVTRRHLTIWK